MRFHYIWKFRWPHKTVAAGGGGWSERPTLPDPLFYISVRVAQSVVFCALFCRLFLHFFLWSSHCRSFNLLLLTTALVDPSIYCFWLPLWSILQFTASDYRFDRSFNLLLLTTALVGPSIYCFWLPLWSVLQSSDYLFGQSFNLLLWLPLWSVLQFTASNYRFGRSFNLLLLATALVGPSILWLPLWSVLQFTASDYLFGQSFNLLLLITALVGPSIYCLWLPLWYLQTFLPLSFKLSQIICYQNRIVWNVSCLKRIV
jgi:hypothetical protein